MEGRGKKVEGRDMIIKVCGMRDVDNIRQAGMAGMDWMGMIFWQKSARYVDNPDTAKAIPEGVKKVGVFVNELPENIVEKADKYSLDIIQLHGSEEVDTIRELRLRLHDKVFVKAISVSQTEDIRLAEMYDKEVDYLLFDTKCKSVGGSGRQFEWSILQNYKGDTPFLLSGGIGPDDAENVKAFKHPMMAGIDLNSKFELSPGLKDVEKLSAFIAETRKV